MSSRRTGFHPLRSFQAGFWVSLFIVAGFALYPDLTLPEPTATRGYTDKIYHVGGFVILTVLAGLGWGVSRELTGVLGMSAIGLELLQIFAEGRGIFLSDIVANFAGLGFGLLLLWLVRQGCHRNVRST